MSAVLRTTFPPCGPASFSPSRRAGYAGRAFSPLEFAPALWLDAGQGVYSDAGETPASANAPAYQWSDLSGNARHFTQETLDNRPLWKVGVANSHPVLRFDGANDLLASSFVSSSTSGALFVVTKIAVDSSATSLVTSSDADSTSRFMRFGFSTSEQPTIHQRDNDTADAAVGSSVDLGGFHLLSFLSTGTAYRLRQNGVEVTPSISGLDSGDWFGDVSSLDNMAIGAIKHTSELQHFAGDIGEVLLFDGALSTSRLRDVEGYLASKYGILLS